MGRPKGSKNKKTAAKRMKKTAPTASQGNVATTHNGSDDDARRSLFLFHRGRWNSFQAQLKEAKRVGKDVKDTLKADGFLLMHMQIADDLSGSPKSEQKVQAAVHERLKVARWMGHPMGAQMDMFESHPVKQETPDRAFDDGKRVGMEGGKCECPKHFSAQFEQSWLSGWHAGQAAKVIGGIKPDAGGYSTKQERWAGDEL